MNKLFHLVSKEDWALCREQEIYYSSSFDVEQFIHLSTKSQIEGTLNNYYSNYNELLLLILDADLISKEVIFEKALNGQEFPHLFSGINKNVLIEVIELRKNTTKWDMESYIL